MWDCASVRFISLGRFVLVRIYICVGKNIVIIFILAIFVRVYELILRIGIIVIIGYC